ncbi:lysosomal proton-coupled steroid conjugate and bile acid symporter SLC46A3 isoform X2 [Bombyx mori]|uniref:Adenylate cyclase n=1 Tax=Bombyx mori TaxID=7091 RepID=A0A8R1WIW0_BOMMO|nr:solute carrier family 46 member 3 isoform X2 [Bombyx mori]
MAGQETEEDPEIKPLNSKNGKFKRKTVVERFIELKNIITVEPVAFIALSSSVFAAVTTQTLSLEKTCRVSLKIDSAICDAIRLQNSQNVTFYEKQVQQYLADRLAWRSVLQSLLPCVILPFIGSWCDKTGRRVLPMMVPVVGEILQCLSNIINVIFFDIPVEVLLFFDAFFPAICGGWSGMFLILFIYISNVTTNENRTHRLGLVNFFTYVGIPIGLSTSGVVLKNFGYLTVYTISTILHLVNLWYIKYRLKDVYKPSVNYDKQGIRHFFRTFFDFANVKDTVGVVFKKAPNNRRVRLCILLAVVTVLFGPMYGEVSILYLSTRYRFNWDEIKFSIFQTYNFVTHTVGTIFSILFFSKYLKWDDSILGIISTISKIAGSFVYCFAPNDKIFFIAPLVEILNGTALLAMRSIFSKMVQPDELGKMNSVVGLTENLMPLLYVPLYTKVYTSTMEVLPGAVFLMGALMTLPAVGAFIWLFVEHRLSLRKTKSEIENQSPD